MKIRKLILLVFLISFVAPTIFAQEKGIIKFFVEVDNGYFEIEVNDTMLIKRYKDTLPVGKYSAKVWSPGYVVTPIDFTIVAGKTVEKHVTMVKNNNFITYENDYKEYRMQFHKQFTAPLTLTLLSSLSSTYFMIKAYNSKKNIISDVELYFKSPNTIELDGIKNRIEDNNKKYNRQRAAFYINTGFTLAFIGGTIWSFKNFNKNNIEPTYNKESPFKEKYSFNLTPYGCSFAIKI